MIVFRITTKEHSSLTGKGGLYGPGRWHRKGNLIIYTSQHASLAAWEKMVHLGSVQNLPDNLLLTKIKIPEGTKILSVPQKILVPGWDGFPYHNDTMDFGTSFLQEKQHFALKVPSVIIPDEYNLILNPLHSDFTRCKILISTLFTFDKRVYFDSGKK